MDFSMTEEEALRYYRRGVAARRIAKAWGVSRQATMARLQKTSMRLSIPWTEVYEDRRVSTTRQPPETRDQVLWLHSLGVSQRRIAQNLKIHRATVNRIIHELGEEDDQGVDA